MNNILVENMKKRLMRFRRVAAIAHDKAVIELVTQTADEVGADLRKMESGAIRSNDEALSPQEFAQSLQEHCASVVLKRLGSRSEPNAWQLF